MEKPGMTLGLVGRITGVQQAVRPLGADKRVDGLAGQTVICGAKAAHLIPVRRAGQHAVLPVQPVALDGAAVMGLHIAPLPASTG